MRCRLAVVAIPMVGVAPLRPGFNGALRRHRRLRLQKRLARLVQVGLAALSQLRRAIVAPDRARSRASESTIPRSASHRRDGDGVARATTSSRTGRQPFPASRARAGRGVSGAERHLWDERGECRAGAYVRDPPGSGHARRLGRLCPVSLSPAVPCGGTENQIMLTPARRSPFPGSPGALPSCRFTARQRAGLAGPLGAAGPLRPPRTPPAARSLRLDGAEEEGEGRSRPAPGCATRRAARGAVQPGGLPAGREIQASARVAA